jgi:hypothetical protein
VAEEVGGGGGWILGEIGGPVHGKVIRRWIHGLTGVVGFPCGETVDSLAAYPASTVSVVDEVWVDAGYCPGEDGHVAY